MDVRPVGSGPPGTNLTQGVGAANSAPKINVPTPAGGLGATPTLDAAILSALSEPDLARLIQILEPQPQNVNQASELLQVVFTAVAAGDVERALAGVVQLVRVDPVRVETMGNEAGLEPIRSQVDSLLAKLVTIAKLDAQSRITHATQLIEESRLSALPDWDADPHTLLTIANRLVEAGGYVNAVRATQVAQLVVDGSHWAPAVNAVSMPGAPEVSESEETRATHGIIPALKESWRGLRGRTPGRFGRVWRRTPLLVLLGAWLLAGTAGGLIFRFLQVLRPGGFPSWITDTGFTVWGVGFLALVLFGFYMRVRNIHL